MTKERSHNAFTVTSGYKTSELKTMAENKLAATRNRKALRLILSAITNRAGTRRTALSGP